MVVTDVKNYLWPDKNPTNPPEVAKRYDEGAYQYSEKVLKDGWNTTFEVMDSEIKELFHASENSRITVLDAGCGDGLLVKFYPFKEMNISLTGIDISTQMLDCCKSRKTEYEKLIACNLEEMFPFSDNTFDHIISNGALGYCLAANPFYEFLRVLKPGGLIMMNFRVHHYKERGYPELICKLSEKCKVVKKKVYDPFPYNPEYKFDYQYTVVY